MQDGHELLPGFAKGGAKESGSNISETCFLSRFLVRKIQWKHPLFATISCKLGWALRFHQLTKKIFNICMGVFILISLLFFLSLVAFTGDEFK
ncbi:hypothetical protein ASG93_13675 [Paenibacillus sp. Soil787]|nr:hypothetical protein ASG93_13675 [Paenibacillus sp. Soil787]